jgi:hypothetical protein
MPIRGLRLIVVAAVAAVTTATALPGAARADTTTPHAILGDNIPVTDGFVDDTLAGSWVFRTTTPYWSVVAAKYSPGTAGRLVCGPVQDNGDGTYTDLYEFHGGSVGESAVELEAIDSNSGRAPLRAYGASASFESTDGRYPLERTVLLAQGRAMLATPNANIDTSGGRFVAVRDIWLGQGQTISMTIRTAARRPPSAKGVQALLFASDPADAGTWIQSGATAVARTPVDGSSRSLTYTAPRSAYYGVVFVDLAAAGSIFASTRIS